MGWLDVFKSKNKCECLICRSMHPRKDVTEIKYRYGTGEGKIGTAFMCSACDAQYNAKEDDEDYGESI